MIQYAAAVVSHVVLDRPVKPDDDSEDSTNSFARDHEKTTAGLSADYPPAFNAFSISGFNTASMFCAVIGPTSL